MDQKAKEGIGIMFYTIIILDIFDIMALVFTNSVNVVPNAAFYLVIFCTVNILLALIFIRGFYTWLMSKIRVR